MKTFLKYIFFLAIGLFVFLVLIFGIFASMSAFRESQISSQAAPTTGKFIQTSAGKIFIQEMGPENGQPLIFIHGSLAWSETWKEVMSNLSSKGYRTIAMDLPPFGFSERPHTPSYSTTDQARRILQVVEAMQLKKPILVGHSFGGSPTAEAAMQASEKFSGLVLIDAAVDPNFKPEKNQDIFLSTFLKINFLRNPILSASLTNPQLTRYLLQKFIYDPNDANDKIVSIYQQPLKIQGTTNALGDWLPSLVFAQSGLLNQSKSSYQNLKLPTLIIWGEKDSVTPISLAYQLDELIPHSELIILEEVGHIPQIEDVEQLNEALITGLRDLKLNNQTNAQH